MDRKNSCDAPSLRESPTWWTAADRHERGRALYVSLEAAIRPSSGECIVDSYWSIHPEHGLAFYYQPFGYGRSDGPSPQCNDNETTSRLLSDRAWPGHEVRHLPVVYMAHAQRAMAADKQALVSARKDGSSQQIPQPPHGGSHE